jgi:anti-anti-sigma regulatory factor
VTALLQRGGTPAERNAVPEVATALMPEVPPAPTLKVELDVRGASCRLTLHGALCGTSLAALEAQVDQLGCLPCEQVIVDMGHLTEIDEVGAKVVLGLYYYVLGRGGALRLTAMSGPVAETLHAVGGNLLALPGAH